MKETECFELTRKIDSLPGVNVSNAHYLADGITFEAVLDMDPDHVYEVVIKPKERN